MDRELLRRVIDEAANGYWAAVPGRSFVEHFREYATWAVERYVAQEKESGEGVKKRVQLVIDEYTVDLLERLRSDTRAASTTEVLRDAIGAYSSLRELLFSKPGLEIGIIDRSRGEFMPLVIPSFHRPLSLLEREKMTMTVSEAGK